MNELYIEPNVAKKTMRLSGVIAAGEHVRVTVRNTYGMSADTTRLRVVCGEHLVAQFPVPGSGEAWIADANDISCVLNLNTVQAELATRCAPAPCLFVLDDVSEDVRQLYGTAAHRLERWVKSPDNDIPIDLDTFPSVIEKFREDISEWKVQVGDALEDYQKTLSSAWNDYRNSIDAAFSQHVATVNAAVAAKADRSDLDRHVSDRANPHKVTADQIGAATRAEVNSVKTVADEAKNAAASAMSSVESEAARASAAELALKNAVAQEESRAVAAEKSLSDSVVDASNAYKNPLKSESDRAKAKEVALESSVIAESNRAKGEENSIRASVVSETKRAEFVESAIRKDVDTALSSIETQDGLIMDAKLAAYYHDPVTGLYYPPAIDSSKEPITIAFDEDHPVEYCDIMMPYFMAEAKRRGDVSAFVVKAEARQTLSVWASNAALPSEGRVEVDFGDVFVDGFDYTGVGGYVRLSHQYKSAGHYVVSVRNARQWQVRETEDIYEDPMTKTKSMVVRVLCFSSSETNLRCTFRNCKNLKGVVPDIPENVTNLEAAFCFTKVSGSLPNYSSSVSTLFAAFENAKLEYVGFDTDITKLLPTTLGSDRLGKFVTNCGIGVLKHFPYCAGGTSGWTGEYYTAANAPVPSLVGERIYEPLKNSTSFEIKVTSEYMVDGKFEFEILFRTLPGEFAFIDWGDGTRCDKKTLDTKQVVNHFYEKTGKFVVVIWGSATELSVGSGTGTTLSNSKLAVHRVLSWSDTIVDVLNAYYHCSNVIGTIPRWGASIQRVGYTYCFCGFEGDYPEWTETIRRADACYFCSVDMIPCLNGTGRIPRWPKSGFYGYEIGRMYRGRNATVWDGATDAELMPDNIAHKKSFEEYAVSRAPNLMPYFTADWGGTKEG